jgi:alpha-glucosidase
MKPPAGANFFRLLMFGLVGGILLPATGAPVAENLGQGISVFYPSEAAKDAALPSIALVVSRRGSLGEGGVTLRPKFSIRDGRQDITVPIAREIDLYGTGEVSGPLLRNGRSVTLWNSDAYGYDAKTPGLYQSHPWVLGVRPDGSAFGIIFDSSYRQRISLPSLLGGDIEALVDGPEFPVIIIERDTPQEVVMALTDLTGKMPLPPKWSLGYHQCRYSYAPDARVLELAHEFRARRIPCDAIWLDIDYMEDFRIFTFDPGRFPQPRKLNDTLHAAGFHSVWMIDPGVKSDDLPPASPPTPADPRPESPRLRAARIQVQADFDAMRATGVGQHVFVMRASRENFQGEVWPGLCYFPDFTRAATRAWWAALYAPFLSQGVDGVWNDMNEPAVFKLPSKTMPEDNIHRADAELGGVGSHAQYHNVYGMEMIRATREGMVAARPDRRPFVLSRANFLGGQRYGATWTGDNTANWEQLAWSIPMVLNLGMSGQPDAGPDIGGFVGSGPLGATAAERGAHFARWMGIGALLPFSRGHTAKENLNKEPWAFGPAVEQTCRLALERRYRLMPYLYSVFREASITGLPVARPLFFADLRDPALRAENRGFLLGDALLVACRVTPAGDQSPALPKGWVRFNFSREDEDPILPELYMRPGSIIPTGPVMQYVDERPLNELRLLVCLDGHGRASGALYEDAGDGYGYQRGDFRLTTFRAEKRDGKVVLSSTHEGDWPAPTDRRIETVVIEGSNRSDLSH